MDMLIFWVTLGFLVEATRAAIQKCSVERRKKEVNPLKEPLLKSVVGPVLDESGKCQLLCCAPEEFFFSLQQEESEEEYYSGTSEEESLDSVDRLRSISEESEEEFEENGVSHGVKIVKWDDLLDNVSVTLVGDRGWKLKGKELVEVPDSDEISETCLTGSDEARSRIRGPRVGRSSAKIYPEPPDQPQTSVQAARSTHSVHSSYDYDMKISDQSAWDENFKAGTSKPAFTGETSKL